ncbi:MAG: hypothetical protein AAF957_13990 [Planctomycetota bacterium]
MNSKQFLSGAGLLVLAVGTASAQANDDCSGATPISGFGTFAWDNTAATGSGLSDCAGLGVRKDLWYLWTASMSGETRFETCNTTTSFATRIAAYDGANCGALSLIDCNSGRCATQSSLTFNAVAGNQYLLRVGSRSIGQGGPGQFVLRQEPCPSTNDDVLEDNDECTESLNLTDGSYGSLWCSKADADWYDFCIAPGTTFVLDILFSHSTGDVDVFSFDTCNGTSLGNSTSASDNEQITIDNTGTTPLSVKVRVEIWPDDPVWDCNNYSLVVMGSSSGCSTGGVGTNYCMANPNSSGSTSSMSGIGTDLASANNLTLQADNVPTNAFGFFLTSQTQGFAMNPGGSQGNICLAGSIGRYVGPGQIQQAGANGLIDLRLDLTMIPQPNGFVAAMAGQTWNFQAWYRDSVMGSATSNFSDGLEVTFN